jgi:hypothetical protein
MVYVQHSWYYESKGNYCQLLGIKEKEVILSGIKKFSLHMPNASGHVYVRFDK